MTTEFKDELRRAITASGRSLRGIREALGQAGHDVGVATLSTWQNGSRVPHAPESLAAVDSLEHILGLQPGHLRNLLGNTRLRGRRTRHEALHQHMPAPPSVERMLEALGSQVRLQAKARDIQEVTYFVTRPAREILVQAVLHEDLSPMNCREFAHSAAGDENGQVLVNASNRAQATRRDFGPGVVGLKWDWQ